MQNHVHIAKVDLEDNNVEEHHSMHFLKRLVPKYDKREVNRAD